VDKAFDGNALKDVAFFGGPLLAGGVFPPDVIGLGAVDDALLRRLYQGRCRVAGFPVHRALSMPWRLRGPKHRRWGARKIRLPCCSAWHPRREELSVVPCPPSVFSKR
jgi:hypothetical protein